nr:hypothetical protein [uncultured Rhodopila sp.]
MSASRSAPAARTARIKTPAPAAKKAVPKRPTADSRKAAEMLREIQIEGEALSARIDRLRHRFL